MPAFPITANQSRQYIFMVLEPNCSILAACLPTYGPLFAGGRAAESIIRSVRGIFSLRSSMGGSGGRSYPINLSAPSLPGTRQKSSGDSQVELQNAENWPGKPFEEAPSVPSVLAREQMADVGRREW
jgi:hypothetical protein